jgi:hypothetical protein
MRVGRDPAPEGGVAAGAAAELLRVLLRTRGTRRRLRPKSSRRRPSRAAPSPTPRTRPCCSRSPPPTGDRADRLAAQRLPEGGPEQDRRGPRRGSTRRLLSPTASVQSPGQKRPDAPSRRRGGHLRQPQPRPYRATTSSCGRFPPSSPPGPKAHAILVGANGVSYGRAAPEGKTLEEHLPRRGEGPAGPVPRPFRRATSLRDLSERAPGLGRARLPDRTPSSCPGRCWSRWRRVAW